MTPDEFIRETEGKTLGYPEGQYVGECLTKLPQRVIIKV